MSQDPSLAATNVPLWMTPQQVSHAEKLATALDWHLDDPRFVVSVPRLQELVADGYQATPKYYFEIVGLPGKPIGFNAWCRKLGHDAHKRIAQAVSSEVALELKPFVEQVGNVNNWTNGFKTLFKYLEEAQDRAGIDLGGLTIVGRPGAPLLSEAKRGGHAEGSDDGGEPESTAGVTSRVRELLSGELNVIVEGVAGSGKSHLLSALSAHYDDVEVVVFHPSTSYEEFVSGLRPQQDGSFTGVAGTFVRVCQRAAQSPEKRFLLFIDEINRANTSRVFGDLLLPVEKSKRARTADLDGSPLSTEKSPEFLQVRLQTPVGPKGNEPGGNLLAVPDNLHILGTMNSTDRSVGTIDLALRRRFVWLEMEPLNADVLGTDPAMTGKLADAVASGDWATVIDWYGQANKELLEELGPDARLGHSYVFSAATPLAAAKGLASQLAEIAFTFNLSSEVLDNIPSIDLSGAGVSVNATYRGQGLGRRPSVAETAIEPASAASAEDGED